MGKRAPGTALAVAVLVVAAVVWSRRDDQRTAQDEEPPGPSFPEGQLLVPGEIDGHELVTVERTDAGRRLGSIDGRSPIVVTRVDAGVVAITTAPVPVPRGEDDRKLDPVPGTTIDSAPVLGYFGYDHMPGLSYALRRSWLAWMPTDDVILGAMSIDLSDDELRDVAEEVELEAGGELVVPGEVIGEIPVTWNLPMPGVTVEYRDDGYSMFVSVTSASPEVQAAYLALAPPNAVNSTTHMSCCSANVSRPPRELRIEGRRATIATISWWERIVVVEGDPGAILVADAGLGDEELIAVVRSLTPVAAGELEPQ